MKTRIYQLDDLVEKATKEDIKKTIMNGKNIVFPTETVYGIGAHALSEEGVKRIYQVKGRPSDNPLIVHLATKEAISPYVYIDQPYVQALMDAFWPGPLTMVFRRKDIVPDFITGGLDTVGIRIPSHPVAKAVLTIADAPICAPSANISGRPSSTLFEHVVEDFNGKVDIILNGGKSEVGLESTVLDVTTPNPIILRPGVITKRMIESIVPHVQLSQELTKDEIPKAPGMKYKHYAPKGNLTIVDGDGDAVIDYIHQQVKHHKEKNETVGIITTDQLAKAFNNGYVFNIGDQNSETDVASNLYIALRTMDALDIEFIYSMAFHQNKYQEAIMNRLYKAANNKVIKV